MEELINDILQYLKGGKIDSILINSELIPENQQSFYTMIIDLLSWLKLEYKRSQWKREKKYIKQKPLELNMDYTWCKILEKIVLNDERFAEFFKIEDGKFDFRESVSEEIRGQARKMVFENYNPKMMK